MYILKNIVRKVNHYGDNDFFSNQVKNHRNIFCRADTWFSSDTNFDGNTDVRNALNSQKIDYSLFLDNLKRSIISKISLNVACIKEKMCVRNTKHKCTAINICGSKN